VAQSAATHLLAATMRRFYFVSAPEASGRVAHDPQPPPPPSDVTALYLRRPEIRWRVLQLAVVGEQQVAPSEKRAGGRRPKCVCNSVSKSSASTGRQPASATGIQIKKLTAPPAAAVTTDAICQTITTTLVLDCRRPQVMKMMCLGGPNAAPPPHSREKSDHLQAAGSARRRRPGRKIRILMGEALAVCLRRSRLAGSTLLAGFCHRLASHLNRASLRVHDTLGRACRAPNMSHAGGGGEWRVLVLKRNQLAAGRQR
jgi:hypothetical protein